MAGYAINVHSILYEPMAWFGRQKRRAITKELQSSESTLETTFLEYFATRETVECKGTYFEVSINNFLFPTNLLATITILE